MEITIYPKNVAFDMRMNIMVFIFYLLAMIAIPVILSPHSDDYIGIIVCCVSTIFFASYCVKIILNYFWSRNGREIITKREQYLNIRREIFGLGFAKQYEIAKIQGLYLTPHDNRPAGYIPEFKEDCRIAFDYGFKKINFANGIDDSEAENIVGSISSACNIHVFK